MRTLKTLVLAASAAAVLASSAWAAQVDLGDATRKARGDYGGASVARSYSRQRMAPAPAANRTFSAEPTVAAPAPAPAPAVQQHAAAPAPQARTFSYEPAPRGTYRTTPRRNVPNYMLPKGDPRRLDPVIR